MGNYKPWGHAVTVGSNFLNITITEPDRALTLHIKQNLSENDLSLSKIGTAEYTVPTGYQFRALHLTIQHTTGPTPFAILEGTLLNNGGTGKLYSTTRDAKGNSQWRMNHTFAAGKYITLGSITGAHIYHCEILGYEEKI